MPLRLKAPRKGKSPNWSIRGTYLRIKVDRSAGTHRRSVAATQLKRLEGQIERGEYPPAKAGAGREQPTFLTAALAYMKAGRSRRNVARLLRHFGETPLNEIDQAAIDEAAVAIGLLDECVQPVHVDEAVGRVVHIAHARSPGW